MSTRKANRQAERAALQSVQRHVDGLIGASSPESTPLPDDILAIATDGYQRGYCPEGKLFGAQKRVADTIEAALPDVLLLAGKGNSLSRHVNGRALLALLPKAVSFRGDQHLIGTYTFAFGFWRKRFLFLTSIEPGGVPTHLHQRILQRSAVAFKSMAEAQDRFSDLWPTLLEVGQRRKLAGERGNISDFVSPWADGLMFGDFSRMDFDAHTLALAAPRMFDYDPKRRIFYEHELPDWYRSGAERLGYILRTYIGPSELRPHQAELQQKLVTFCATHRRVIEHFKNVGRLGIGHSNGTGEALAEMLGMPTPNAREIDEAVTALDDLSSSELWLAEVAKSRENRMKATAARVETQEQFREIRVS